MRYHFHDYPGSKFVQEMSRKTIVVNTDCTVFKTGTKMDQHTLDQDSFSPKHNNSTYLAEGIIISQKGKNILPRQNDDNQSYSPEPRTGFYSTNIREKIVCEYYH